MRSVEVDVNIHLRRKGVVELYQAVINLTQLGELSYCVRVNPIQNETLDFRNFATKYSIRMKSLHAWLNVDESKKEFIKRSPYHFCVVSWLRILFSIKDTLKFFSLLKYLQFSREK